MKLSEIIDLDNGTAYLGFVQETSNLANVTLIENWAFHSNVKSNQKDPWGGLSLRYMCQWPLHLIFSPDMLEKYNTIYRFLLPVKRIQIELQYVWAQKVRAMKHLINEPVFRQAMQLRQHMSFLIDNLYSYLQVDVLESQWSKLYSSVKASRDFEEVRILHDKYLASIVEQFFLNHPKVLRTLQDVLLMCQKLCRLLKEMEQEDMRNEQFREQFWSIKQNFERQSSRVFQLLSNFRNNHQSAPYLAQLLLRIDYNGYFTELGERIQAESNQSEMAKMAH